MQNVGVSVFSASNARQASASLLFLYPSAGMNPFLTQMREAIQTVDPALAGQFAIQQEHFMHDLSESGKKGQAAYARLVGLLKGLDGSWGRVRNRLFHHHSRPMRRDIAARIAQFEIGRSLLPASSKYLKALLDEAEVYGLLPNVWQIIRHNMTSCVSILDEKEKEWTVQRNVDDCLASILVYLLLEDYERVMGGQRDAKTLLLLGEMDVVAHPVPSENATYAIYKAPLKTLFLDYLPDLDSLYCFQYKKEEGIDFPEAGLIVQESALAGVTKPYVGFEMTRQVKDWLFGSIYLVSRGRKGIMEEKEKLIRIYERERRKLALFLETGWGKDVADVLLPLYHPVQADFLDAAQASQRDEKKWAAFFEKANASYRNTQAAVILFQALDAGVELADAIEQQEADGGAALSAVPQFFIQNGYLKYTLARRLSYSQAWDVLIQQNWDVLEQLHEADALWRVAYKDAVVIRQYFRLHAAFAQMALRRKRRQTAIMIIKDYLLPLILFVTEREYHDSAV